MNREMDMGFATHLRRFFDEIRMLEEISPPLQA